VEIGAFRQLLIELPPLLLGPPQLFDCGRQVQKMDRNDGGPRPEIGVSDQCIQLPPGFYQPGVDERKSLALLSTVVRWVSIQGGFLRSRVVKGRFAPTACDISQYSLAAHCTSALAG
jgi:hypothetical protein